MRLEKEKSMVTLAGVEPATCGLGNRRSIHLSYRATDIILSLRQGLGSFASLRISPAGSTPAKRLNLGNRRSIHLSYRATDIILSLSQGLGSFDFAQYSA